MASTRVSSYSPVIAVDIDNVVADTDTAVRALIEHLYGIHAERDDITTWRYSDCLPITLDQEERLFRLLHTHHLATIPQVPGAIEGLRALASIAPVWLVTARPDSSRPATEQWLTSNGALYNAIIFTNSKLQIPGEALFYVDDNADTVSQLLAASKHVLMMDRPWNRTLPDNPHLTRVHSWPEVIRVARRLVPSRPAS